jgi:hypothetical protein
VGVVSGRFWDLKMQLRVCVFWLLNILNYKECYFFNAKFNVTCKISVYTIVKQTCLQNRFFDFQKETIPVKEWNEEQVKEWLMETAVKKYKPLIDDGTTGAQLLTLSKPALYKRFSKVC